MKSVTCDMCGKEMYFESIDSEYPKEKIIIGGKFGEYVDNGSKMQLRDELIDFIKKQCGKYKLGKKYRICYECYYESLGLKP